MKCHRAALLLSLMLLLACAIVAAAADLPAPSAVIMADDPEEDEGIIAIVSWSAPTVTEADTEGWALAGYEVYIRRLPDEFDKIALIPDPEATSTEADNLVPWQRYEARVDAFYLPEGEAVQVAEEQPMELANTQVRRSGPAVSPEPVSPVGKWFNRERTNVLAWVIGYSAIVLLALYFARRRDMYIRPIAGLQAVDDALGRATEMGRPILYISGLSGIGDIATIAAMLILGHLAKRAAHYETPIIVPCQDPLVMTAEREIVREAYLEAGKPQNYDPANIFYVTDSQFGYVAAVDGIMLRQKPAANFYMGYFYAEALMLAETGNATGAIQIAGTDADSQLPFFITACDYTLMGEELYAASAYLSRNPLLVAQLKGQDIGKIAIIIMLILGTIAATAYAALPEVQWLQAFVDFFAVKG